MHRRCTELALVLAWVLASGASSACERKSDASAAEDRVASPETSGEPQVMQERTPLTGGRVDLHPKLQSYVEEVVVGFATIPEDRKRRLRQLASFIQEKHTSDETAHLTYICTHNSRRSHMSQLWAATAAAWYGIEDVGTFSGGTEATAFNPRAVAALERAGFAIDDPGGDNPRYGVSYGPNEPVMECFSKKYDDPPNPAEGFAAVMTCSQADKSCPIVFGAGTRVAIPKPRTARPKKQSATMSAASRSLPRCSICFRKSAPEASLYTVRRR